jgi:hypothetical protein
MLGSHLIPERLTESHGQPNRRNRGNDIIVLGFDSETLQGPPITLQFYSDQVTKRFTGCVFIGKRSATTVFLSQLEKLPSGRYRMYGHNLEFDMLSVLWNVRSKLLTGSFELKIGKWVIQGRFTKPIFATFRDGERTVELVDSILWFQTSLERAGKIVCPDLPKLKRPVGLGITMYKPSDTAFVEYAMRDAVVAYHLGLAIERFHEELEIPSQISLASMAAACFRINYLQRDVYQPPRYEWMAMAQASYHGGVNRVRPGASPGWHTNVTALDLSSAYPFAMSGFPDFSNAAAYRSYKRIKRRTPIRVPDLGIYRISGTAVRCDWPALFGHDFKPIQGRFVGQAVSGYELNVALQSREVKLTSIEGFIYDETESDYSPFKAYVDYFYNMKATATDPTLRYMYKIMLNGVTGKFIQTSEDYTLVDGQLVRIQRAGGLYHPFIASLITGHTRSVMHPLEHKYKALHTATDGIFAPGNHHGAKAKVLGAVVDEGHGDLALFRNKLYILYSNEETEDTYPSQVFDGRHILKCARHGFQGTVGNLEQMLITQIRKYKVNRPLKLKSATKSGDAPNKFVTQGRTLNNIGEFKVFNHG